MSESSDELKGPDLEKGMEIGALADGGMVLGHAFGQAILVARCGDEFFGIEAKCTHYGGPLEQGLMVDCTIRCPWHHARFDLRTGEAMAAPALRDATCWKIEKRESRIFVTGKIERKRVRRPKSSPKNVLIVGAGAAGGAAAEMLRRQGYEGAITLIGADEFLPYDRPNLSKDYLAGKAQEESIPLWPPDFYHEQKIEALTKTRVAAIDPGNGRITLSDGRSLGYDSLLLATGAEPIRLSIPGADLPHVCYLRTLADSRRIIEKARRAKRAIIIGSSFIGLEVAASLRERKLEVTVLGKHEHPLENVLGHELSGLIRETHESRGVEFHLGRTPATIRDREVQLDNGTVLEGDLVVVGIGVRPNTELAERAGLATDDGVLVNEYLETSARGIFAAGDIARWPDRRAGRIRVEHWVVAQWQGQAAARNILGAREPFVLPPFFWSNHFDLEIGYVGHGGRDDRAIVSGELRARDGSVFFRKGGKTTAVVSVGHDVENLEAELAFERGEEFDPISGEQ